MDTCSKAETRVSEERRTTRAWSSGSAGSKRTGFKSHQRVIVNILSHKSSPCLPYILSFEVSGIFFNIKSGLLFPLNSIYCQTIVRLEIYQIIVG